MKKLGMLSFILGVLLLSIILICTSIFYRNTLEPHIVYFSFKCFGLYNYISILLIIFGLVSSYHTNKETP